MTVVSNTSPITNLAAIAQLDLLHQLYQEIAIPQTVYDEMADIGKTVPGTLEVQTLPWIKKQQISNLKLWESLQFNLDPGEAAAIVLALELKAELLIMDERPGRTMARQYGLPVIGILGVLVEAKDKGLIRGVKPLMDRLVNEVGFRVSRQLYETILQRAGE
jgi:hypothetical protein